MLEANSTDSDVRSAREEAIKEILSYKINLDQRLDLLLNYRQRFFLKNDSSNLTSLLDHPYSDLCTLIDEMSTSYVAPAYHYNSYIDNLIKDLTWGDNKYSIDESLWESNVLRRVKYQSDIQSVFLSIKTCLDRLVSIFSYYVKGISTSTTFGRYKVSGKASGLMSKVNELKNTDDLMAYIEKSYHEWIKFAVSPRDTISHYNDLSRGYFFDSSTGFEIPIHGSRKLMSNSADEDTFTFISVKAFIDKWYEFFARVIGELIERPLVVEQARF